MGTMSDTMKTMDQICESGWNDIKGIFSYRSKSEIDMLKTLYGMAFRKGWQSMDEYINKELMDIFENGFPEEDKNDPTNN